jgi:hypothetical protein
MTYDGKSTSAVYRIEVPAHKKRFSISNLPWMTVGAILPSANTYDQTKAYQLHSKRLRAMVISGEILAYDKGSGEPLDAESQSLFFAEPANRIAEQDNVMIPVRELVKFAAVYQIEVVVLAGPESEIIAIEKNLADLREKIRLVVLTSEDGLVPLLDAASWLGGFPLSKVPLSNGLTEFNQRLGEQIWGHSAIEEALTAKYGAPPKVAVMETVLSEDWSDEVERVAMKDGQPIYEKGPRPDAADLKHYGATRMIAVSFLLEVARGQGNGVLTQVLADAITERNKTLSAGLDEPEVVAIASETEKISSKGKPWTDERLKEVAAYRQDHGTLAAAKHFGISTALIREKLPNEKTNKRNSSPFGNMTNTLKR